MIELDKFYIASVFQGASALYSGTAGFTPQALSGDEVKFLRGDSTWQPLVENIPPLSSNSPGNIGEIRFDTDFIYICTSTDSWKRVGIAGW